MSHHSSTIFALATPMGRSGVAVIRISGKDALTALPFFGYTKTPEPRKAIYHHFTIPNHPTTPSSNHLDTGLILYFPTPHSFTGEDCLEFQIHGSIAVIKKMLSLLSTLPHFRMAEPGEFARRAFDNGKMDLTAAEGLADLIDAETEWQRQNANYAAQGHVKKVYEQLRQKILTPYALLEAYIDFPDEDIPEETTRAVDGSVREAEEMIRQILAQSVSAEKIREGFTVVILGAPNAGKSSLLNALSQKEAAIVSHRAGTTRDCIEVYLDIDGIPVTLVDTAGIRETADEIESEGIARAKSHAAMADLKLLLKEPSAVLDDEIESLGDENTLCLLTKSDTLPPSSFQSNEKWIPVSVKHQESLLSLLSLIKSRLSEKLGLANQTYFVRERHRTHLSEALSELSRYHHESDLVLRCERLRLGATEIGKITGVISADEILGVIFSTFCIGK